MRRLATAFLAVLVLATPLVLAQEKPTPNETDDAPTKHAHKKDHQKIEDAVKRCYAKAKSDDDLEVARVQILKTHDTGGLEAVAFVVEYKSGDVGLFLGSLDPDKDQGPIMIQKKDTEVVQEIFRRADRR